MFAVNNWEKTQVDGAERLHLFSLPLFKCVSSLTQYIEIIFVIYAFTAVGFFFFPCPTSAVLLLSNRHLEAQTSCYFDKGGIKVCFSW